MVDINARNSDGNIIRMSISVKKDFENTLSLIENMKDQKAEYSEISVEQY